MASDEAAARPDLSPPADGRQRVYVVRHGERIDFVDEGFQRRAQLPNHYVPLTKRGVRMAGETGRQLRGQNISKIYSSPFVRCVSTAHEIAVGARRQIPSPPPPPIGA